MIQIKKPKYEHDNYCTCCRKPFDDSMEVSFSHKDYNDSVNITLCGKCRRELMEALSKADSNSALDHIHNAVRDDAYRRGYEQGKADAAPKWIPVTEKLPEEHDTMFAKYWGTDRWNEYMFRKKSDLVEVTVELEDGTRYTDASRTYDGKWDVEERHGVKKKVVAWHYMSEPWEGEADGQK